MSALSARPTWREHADRITRTYQWAKAVPNLAAIQPAQLIGAVKREADALVAECDRMESAYLDTARGLAAWAVVTAYLQATRTGLSATTDRGFCVVEQDGTTLHCAPTVQGLADWCRAQDIEEKKAPTGGFRDYMAREWIT